MTTPGLQCTQEGNLTIGGLNQDTNRSKSKRLNMTSPVSVFVIIPIFSASWTALSTVTPWTEKYQSKQ